MSAAMQQLVMDQRLAFVATVCEDGRPNLSPKGTTIVWDDEHLLFADVASPTTVANLRRDPRVELNVVDPIARRGYRFAGTADVHAAGEPEHACGLEILRAAGSTLPADRVRSIVVIAVTEASEVWSPAYDLGATKDEVVARWLDHHHRLHLRG